MLKALASRDDQEKTLGRIKQTWEQYVMYKARTHKQFDARDLSMLMRAAFRQGDQNMHYTKHQIDRVQAQLAAGELAKVYEELQRILA